MKEIIPGVGEEKTINKLEELEKRAGTLPVIFAVLFTHSILGAVASIPMMMPNYMKYFITSIAVGIIYLYTHENEMYDITENMVDAIAYTQHLSEEEDKNK